VFSFLFRVRLFNSICQWSQFKMGDILQIFLLLCILKTTNCQSIDLGSNTNENAIVDSTQAKPVAQVFSKPGIQKLKNLNTMDFFSFLLICERYRISTFGLISQKNSIYYCCIENHQTKYFLSGNRHVFKFK